MFGESEILGVQIERKVEIRCNQGGKNEKVAVIAGAKGKKRGWTNIVDEHA